MRLAVAILFAAACGTEPTRSASPDAGLAATDDGGSGSGTPLSVCDEAAQHSDLAWIQTNVFDASCARSSCHVTGNEAGGLVLEAGKSHDYLVNMPSTVDHGMMRVMPGDPAQSYLLVALGGEPGMPPEGTVMPWGGLPMLCAQEVDALERWVTAGANP